MFARLFMVLVLALCSMPVLNFGTGLVSEPNNVSVAVGLSVLLALLVFWYHAVCHYVKYFRGWLEEKGYYSSAKKAGRTGLMILLAVSAISSTGCRKLVDPGHVGIQVNYYGEDRGVASYPKVTGIVWYNPITTTVFQYPTYVQNAVWSHNVNEGRPINEEITFTTNDKMQVAADISLAYHLVPDKVPAFYVKFRSDDLQLFTHGFLRNLAREKFDAVAGKYKIDQIMGDNAPFLEAARLALQKELDLIGVQLDQFGFIGAPRPPPTVIDAINATTKAVQDSIRVENELRQSTAEAAKRVAAAEGDARATIAKAAGEAKANDLLTKSLSQTLLEWRRLDIQQQSVQKWNGQLPVYNGGGLLPMIQVPSSGNTGFTTK